MAGDFEALFREEHKLLVQAREARAYLGASNIDASPSAEKNRQTDVRKRDDIELRELSPSAEELEKDQCKHADQRVYSQIGSSPSSRVWPIHLVCCAANDLGGDQLGNLSRGSRSAVLSKLGFAIGDHYKPWETQAPTAAAALARRATTVLKARVPSPRWLERLSKTKRQQETLTLGSAITASAAAFNSNMGSLSMTLGAGVTFLCSALNLRLGLWLPHPLSYQAGAPLVSPGWLFLKEMFGATKSGTRWVHATRRYTPIAEYVHLSDGGHFENLALYELVRRHCRYIIVSDCGADREVAFDDFGNAVRRIREDFGVEIDIDLSPLKPGPERLSQQHLAVGTISYDPRGDQKDTGILLYFKPTLTGDEPCDIAQYKMRNAEFPHETTGDQFYDEAQWESYRRLGEHAVRSALRFVERRGASRFPDAVFNGARWEWYQSPERLNEKIVELTGRLAALEETLRVQGPRVLVREIYPELQTINPDHFLSKILFCTDCRPIMGAEDMRQTLHYLVQMIQLMEDVWLICHLETHWNHPNNLGWLNTFQRWAYTPSFRLWWPILKPMYGSKFRRFMEEHLDLADEDYPPTISSVSSWGCSMPKGVAQIYWTRMKGTIPTGKTVYSYDLDLPLQLQSGAIARTYSVQVGLAFLDLRDRPIARWTAEDLFVPPSLWGAGIGGKFLEELLKKLRARNFTRCEVTAEPQKRTDFASRQQRNDLLAFYKRAGFRVDGGNRLVYGSHAPEPLRLGSSGSG